MTIHTVCAAVRAHGGEVLLCGPTPSGYVVRADVYHQPCRIILPSSGQSAACIPAEPGCLTHVVSDVQSLQDWFISLTSKQICPAS